VIHRYYGALVQEWFKTREEAVDAIPRLRREVIEMVENYTGYGMGEWWFDSTVGYGVQEVYEFEKPYKIVEEKG